jgi:hypothetical protein
VLVVLVVDVVDGAASVVLVVVVEAAPSVVLVVDGVVSVVV